MNPSLGLALLSVMFVGTFIGVVIKQHKAKSCPRHRKFAGLTAQILAAACLVAGIILAGLAVAGGNAK
jgi:hypothetical protein